ncbi:MAG: type II toxin-antitoxin system RelE/ParE family toxin [Pseudomonas sp.]
MTDKPVRILPQAEHDLRKATVWYRDQGGEGLALKWADAVAAALRHVGGYPRTGGSRYAVALQLDGLRFWPIQKFPYLIFYIERDTHLDVWRVLHAQRDIPAWMGDAPGPTVL